MQHPARPLANVKTSAERLPVGGSSHLERRVHSLREYLASLHEALESHLKRPLNPVRLMVLNETDWRGTNPYPYGFTFFRRLKDGSGMIFAPADYPGSLLWVFRALLTRASIKPNSSLEMFLDLTLGHELGHAVADQLGLRTGVRWLDEFVATYVYLAALKLAMPDMLETVMQWGHALSETKLECALANPELIKPSGQRKRVTKRRAARAEDILVQRRDLGAFEYPLVRLPLANQAWYQARFTLFAYELLQKHDLEFIRRLLEIVPISRGRGSVSRAIVKLEPRFKTWFASFGDANQNAAD
jgi:hypothetical protein